MNKTGRGGGAVVGTRLIWRARSEIVYTSCLGTNNSLIHGSNILPWVFLTTSFEYIWLTKICTLTCISRLAVHLFAQITARLCLRIKPSSVYHSISIPSLRANRRKITVISTRDTRTPLGSQIWPYFHRSNLYTDQIPYRTRIKVANLSDLMKLKVRTPRWNQFQMVSLSLFWWCCFQR